MLLLSSVKECPEKTNYIRWKFIFWCICKPAEWLLKSPYVCMHETIQELLNRFSKNLVLGSFTKIF
jgi:hypothetical protein